MTSTDPDGRSDQVGYAEAIAELDTILGELEASDVDVDLLGSRVARAAELIELCRGRIDRARMTIDQVVVSLDQPANERADSSADE